MAKKNLVQIIRDNPGAHVEIDNDCWWLYASRKDREEQREPLIGSDDDFEQLGDGGYGSGNTYGGDILQALAQIVGITVESV